MKWKLASAKYRKDIARALTTATPALLAAGRGRPDDPAIRRALLRYGFNTKQRADPPGDVAEALAWIARHSLPVSALAAAAIARRVLEDATCRLDGRNAAASTATAPHRPRQRDGLRHRARPPRHQPHPGTQVNRAEGLQPGGPAQRRQPAAGAGTPGGSESPAAKRGQARRILRGHVLRRAPT
jgi:hypothetical protein